MTPAELISLTRDCEATRIPIGIQIKIPKGTKVQVTQSFGGNYTVITEDGYMLQIAGEDADALGKETKSVPSDTAVVDQPIEKLVWDQLRACYDPEIPVNIVDLGLVYECRITPLPEGGHKVEVKMTLTAPGCGMGGPISADAQRRILALPGVKEASVELVWDPPWDQSRMSDAAKLKLGML
jgi:probable FeS assembly SUF system protein SufT